ncbi:LRR receptor-like serine/threonine-protein kinase GSO1 [Geodia barretti]|uniref:LRR receptor-like serine/threonine-protein kinase GSO1 n=1 Tax=Geodia barretti TaxID=519541 RepID=A0AA35U1J0_GEOBA|nr:LRR receptor-like serine/threonine-protein kinase GSO1 [Geodia barretti]
MICPDRSRSSGRPVELTHLHLQNNDLTGAYRQSWETSLYEELRLDSNDLTGQLPPELGSLIRVTRLWVADNDLSGSIPAELGDGEPRLAEPGAEHFSGQIPAELGNLSRMRRLYIYENDLSGPIPGALGSLSRLTHIVAQANDLSGEIPEELGSLANLVWMGLHDNDLTGEIPAELGGLAKLQRLYLTNNELYGEVPEELGDLSALTDLWLNHNYLSGQIPHSLDNLDKLSRLRLAGNRAHGCLPAGLAAVGNSDADQLGLETCADPPSEPSTEYRRRRLRAVAPKQAATGDCATGGAVPDAANNPGLVSDCEALLAARDTLARTGSLNWSADTPITKWDGITVRGTPMFRNLAFAMRCVQCGHEWDVPRPLDYPKLMSIPITVGRLKSGYPARTAGQRATETTG